MEQTFLTNFTRKSTPSVSKAFLRLALPLLFLSLFVHTTFGQNIPDANFAAAIRAACPTCIKGGNVLTAAAAANLTTLDVSNKGITNLTGISAFTKLSYLNCSFNTLTSLPSLPTTLTKLDCSDNKLSALPNLPTSLIELDCSNNGIVSLPTVSNNLGYLDCSNNKITCFNSVANKLPTGIGTLICHYNNITYLPTLPSAMLVLRIDSNKITCLPNLPTGLVIRNAANVRVSLPVCGVMTQPTPPNVCGSGSITLTAKFNGNRTVVWQIKYPNELNFKDYSPANYIANSITSFTLSQVIDGMVCRAVFSDCNTSSSIATNSVRIAAAGIIPIPTVAIVQPTCSTQDRGTITITNLPTGYSSQLNNGAITLSKTVYSRLTAGTYTIKVLKSGTTCTSSATVNLTNNLQVDATKCYRLVNRQSGLVLDVRNASPFNNAAVVVSPRNTASNQNWGFTALTGGYFKVTSKRSNLALTASSTIDGATVVQYSYSATNVADWKVMCADNGYYRLQHRLSSKYLSVGITTIGNTAIIQSLNSANLAQQWQIVEATCLSTQNLTTNTVSNITASAEAGRNRIQFLTNQGFRTDYFEIEKQNATTGDFEKLVLLNNTQTDEAMQIHTMYDNKPDNGESHYRLKTTYLSGDFDYSAIQTVKRSASSAFTISPNPATYETFIDLKTFENHAITLSISDVSGKNLWTEQLKSATAAPHRLDVSALPTGLYFVKVQAQGKREVTHKLQVTQ